MMNLMVASYLSLHVFLLLTRMSSRLMTSSAAHFTRLHKLDITRLFFLCPGLSLTEFSLNTRIYLWDGYDTLMQLFKVR